MTQTAREIADGIMDAMCLPQIRWRDSEPDIELRDAIESALITYGNARIEDAAKVADGFTCGVCGADGKAAAAIRSLATKEGEET